MTEPLFFDTDCLSAFLWVSKEGLLVKLYPDRVIVPRAVYLELCYPTIPHLKTRVDSMIAGGAAKVADIAVGTDEYDAFYRMTKAPDAGHGPIGDGEAAAVVLAWQRRGIVASNNLGDVKLYANEYGLKIVTTGAILVDAYHKGLITETDGNEIWINMVAKRRKLGAASFSDYLATYARP